MGRCWNIVTSVVTAIALSSAPVLAEPNDAARAQAVSLFAQGQRAFDHGDYRAAAEAFESAHRLMPHLDALWNAARAWSRARDDVRAANLFAEYLRTAPVSARGRDVATTELARLSTRLGRIDIQGNALVQITLDEQSIDGHTRYVAPGAHIVRALVNGTELRRTVSVDSGRTVSVVLEDIPSGTQPAPESTAPSPPRSRTAEAEAPPAEPTASTRSGGLPRGFVIGGGVLTAIGIGLTTWSGVDTLASLDRFKADRTQTNLEDGRSRQTRTNVLLGVTIGLATLTGVAAVWLVDWRGERERASVRWTGSSVQLRFER